MPRKAVPQLRMSQDQANSREKLTQAVNAAIDRREPKVAFEQAAKAAAQYQSENDLEGQALACYLLGICYRRLNDLPASLQKQEESCARYRALDNMLGNANALRAKAAVLNLLGRTEEAIRDLKHCCTLYSQLGERTEESRTLMNLAIVYKQSGDAAAAQDLFFQCLAFLEQSEQTSATVRDTAKVLLNIATNYNLLEDAAEAIRYAKRGIPLFESLDDQHSLSMALEVLGAAYLNGEDYEEAMRTLGTALTIAEKVEIDWVTAIILDDISAVQIRRGQFDEARVALERCLQLNSGDGYRSVYAANLEQLGRLYMHPEYAGYDVGKALLYLQQAQIVAEEINSPRRLVEVYTALAELYERCGDFAQALDSFRAFHTAEKRLFNEASAKRIKQLELERAQQEAEIAHLRSVELANALSEAERLRALAEHHARTDDLTGVYNRRHLKEHLLAEIERAAIYGYPLSVAIVDVDYFKRINDTFGHGVGDAVLGRVAQLISASCRADSRDIVARYGGEEFVLVLSETGQDTARSVCEQLRERIEKANWSEVAQELGRMTITISVGVSSVRNGATLFAPSSEGESVFPEVGRFVIDMYDVLSEADQNLYKAKRAGRNCVTGS